MSSRNALAIAGLVVLVALLPVFVHSDYILNLCGVAGIYAIAVMGLGILLGFTGQMSLAQAAFFGIGAYTSGWLTDASGLVGVARDRAGRRPERAGGIGRGIPVPAALGPLPGARDDRLRHHHAARADQLEGRHQRQRRDDGDSAAADRLVRVRHVRPLLLPRARVRVGVRVRRLADQDDARRPCAGSDSRERDRGAHDRDRRDALQDHRLRARRLVRRAWRAACSRTTSSS